jgi:hypothetical protein
LRNSYPISSITVLSDGHDDPRYQKFIDKYNVRYILGERLYGKENGGAMIHRRMKVFLENPAEYYIKIDTDTEVFRPFNCFPKMDYFGNFVENLDHQINCIQGGAVGWSHNAVKDLYKSKLFLSEDLLFPEKSWALDHQGNVMEFLIQAHHNLKMIRTDFVEGFCCKKLGIIAQHFDEIKSTWRIPTENIDLKYAITHPVFDKYPGDPHEKENYISGRRLLEKKYSQKIL